MKKYNVQNYVRYKNDLKQSMPIVKPYAFGLIKVIDPDLDEFINNDLVCEKAKVKVLKPDWI